MLVKSEKKTIWSFLCQFNNSNFEDINELYKNLIKIYKFWRHACYLKNSYKKIIY